MEQYIIWQNFSYLLYYIYWTRYWATLWLVENSAPTDNFTSQQSLVKVSPDWEKLLSGFFTTVI